MNAEKHQIMPDRITKPIQLLGAWLVGLLTIDASFLFAATSMDINSWQSFALTIAAIFNVPIFIIALFLLQTKFRPELQEDSYYASYLNNKTNQFIKVPKRDIQLEEMERKIEQLEWRLSLKLGSSVESNLTNLSFAVNTNLKDKEDIESKLFEFGINIVREFGEGLETPDDRRVAIASNMPQKLQNEILGFARKLGFESYSLIEPWEEIDEDVLFGSYGDAEGKIRYKAISNPSELATISN